MALMRTAPFELSGHLLVNSDAKVLECDGNLTFLLGMFSSEALNCSCWGIVRGIDNEGQLVCKPDCKPRLALHQGQIAYDTPLVAP